jgi:hypothetical protein
MTGVRLVEQYLVVICVTEIYPQYPILYVTIFRRTFWTWPWRRMVQ